MDRTDSVFLARIIRRWAEERLLGEERTQRVVAQWMEGIVEELETRASERAELPVQLAADAYMPERAHPTDAGLDLRAREDAVIPAGGSAEFWTGVHVQLPPGHAGTIWSKSGLNMSHGITTTGLIDEGYTGEIVVKLYNGSDEGYPVRRGDKIAQLVIQPVSYVTPVRVDEVQGGERGPNGFGSTGR